MSQVFRQRVFVPCNSGLFRFEGAIRPVYASWPVPTSKLRFNKSPLQLHLIGARGGRAFGRNQRLRRALLPTTPPDAVPRRAALLQTTAEAIALLDAQF